jgi:hypothetical protein
MRIIDAGKVDTMTAAHDGFAFVEYHTDAHRSSAGVMRMLSSLPRMPNTGPFPF